MDKISTLNEIITFTPDKFLNQIKKEEICIKEPSEKLITSVLNVSRTQTRIIEYNIRQIYKI